MKLSNSPGSKNLRRLSSYERLQSQLERGVKWTTSVDEKGIKVDSEEKLSPEDIERIEKEMKTLETRISPQDAITSSKFKKYRGPR